MEGYLVSISGRAGEVAGPERTSSELAVFVYPEARAFYQKIRSRSILADNSRTHRWRVEHDRSLTFCRRPPRTYLDVGIASDFVPSHRARVRFGAALNFERPATFLE